MVLASPRALLPVVKAVSTVSVTRLLNADGKTVARLVADHSTVTAVAVTAAAAPGDTTAELPWRLSITEVRGYPGRARKAAVLLAGVPGVSQATHNVLTAALNALGRHPADYSSSVDAEITAQMPASVAVARLLLRLLDTLEQNVDGVLRDIDTEFLHDLRVAVRRTRSAVKLLGGVLPASLVAHYGAEFKWLGDLTTPTLSRSAPSWRPAGRASSGGWPRRCAGRGSGPSPTTGARRCSRSVTRAAPARAGSPPRPNWRSVPPGARSGG